MVLGEPMEQGETGMSWPTTRQAAREAGVTKYQTGKPCVHGHVAPRYTQNARCVLCVRDRERTRRQESPQRRERERQWRENNRDYLRRRSQRLRQAAQMWEALTNSGYMASEEVRKAVRTIEHRVLAAESTRDGIAA